MQDLARATRIAPGSTVDLADHKPGAKLRLRGEDAAPDRTHLGITAWRVSRTPTSRSYS